MSAPRSTASATRVSGPGSAALHKGRVCSLARLSLSALSFTMLTACLVDDPPSYEPPKRTPPRLVYHRASPPLDRILVARAPDTLLFSIPVASEDAGEGLRTQLFVDGLSRNYDTLPPSTLDDTERVVRFTHTVEDNLKGYCHIFKIRVSHISNLPVGNGPALDDDDLAEVYWLAYLNLPSDQTVPVDDCFYLPEDKTP